MKNLTFLFILSGIFSLLGCGKPVESGGPGGIPGSLWSGDFEPIVNGVYQSPQKVNFNFKQDDSFILAAQPNFAAQGTYTDYAENQELSVNIANSNFDLFGKDDETKMLRYELGERELRMEDKSGRYLLVREKTSDEEMPFDGDWGCRPADGSRWTFNFSKETYRASKTIGSNKPIFIEGNVDYTDDKPETASAILRVNTTSQDEYKDQILKVSTTGEDKMQIVQLDEKFNPIEGLKPIDCSK